MRYMRKYLFVFFVIAVLPVINSCDIFSRCNNIDCLTPPTQIRIRVLNGNDDLIYNRVISADSVKIYAASIENDYILPHFIVTDDASSSSIIVCEDMPWLSLEGINDFFLTYNDANTDSIYLIVEASTYNCCVYHPIKEILINGSKPELDNKLNCFNIYK